VALYKVSHATRKGSSSRLGVCSTYVVSSEKKNRTGFQRIKNSFSLDVTRECFTKRTTVPARNRDDLSACVANYSPPWTTCLAGGELFDRICEAGRFSENEVRVKVLLL
jgi:hypothetical protein